MFLRLHNCAPLSATNMSPTYLQHATNFAGRALQDVPRSRQDACAFLCGAAGIHAIAAAVSNEMGKTQVRDRTVQSFASGFDACADVKWDEMLVGRAGFVSGVHWLNGQLRAARFDVGQWAPVCRQMLNSGRQYVQDQQLDVPLMYQYHGTEYLGAAHGLSGILQVLLMQPEWLDNEDDEMAVWRAVDWLVERQDAAGDFPTATDSVVRQDRKLMHWCHGAGGIIHLLLQAHLRRPNGLYLTAARRSADAIWQRGLLKKGPGICHGVAGSGLAMLVMYRQTGEQLYLHRAARMADFLEDVRFLESARVPDRPYSLYEGVAGTVCFLCDLLEPERAAFPFMEVR